MSDHKPHTAVEARLAIQFENLTKQEHAARFGMWIFLGSEVLLFAGLFGLYAAYRVEYSAEFERAFHHNEALIGTLNTVILILSSFTIAWSIHALRRERRRTALLMLFVTLACGSLFLVFKGVEYSHHFAEGIFPGAYYSFAEMPSNGARLFFTLYFFMTGLHALHMIAGLVLVSWLTTRVYRRRTTSRYHTELEMGALYWHLVDSIWIFLWPLFYLTG
jgi:cytochrome c oxidase subunit III